MVHYIHLIGLSRKTDTFSANSDPHSSVHYWGYLPFRNSYKIKNTLKQKVDVLPWVVAIITSPSRVVPALSIVSVTRWVNPSGASVQLLEVNDWLVVS